MTPTSHRNRCCLGLESPSPSKILGGPCGTCEYSQRWTRKLEPASVLVDWQSDYPSTVSISPGPRWAGCWRRSGDAAPFVAARMDMTHGSTHSVPTNYGGRSNERRSVSALVWLLYLPQKHRVPARVIHFHQQVSPGGEESNCYSNAVGQASGWHPFLYCPTLFGR